MATLECSWSCVKAFFRSEKEKQGANQTVLGQEVMDMD